MIVGGVKESATGRIGEVVENDVHQPNGFVDPTLFEIRFVQTHERIGERGVVIEVGIELGVTMAIGVKQPAIVASHARADKARDFVSRDYVLGLIERRAGSCHRVDHEAVPGDDDFVVAPGPHALFSGRKQLRDFRPIQRQVRPACDSESSHDCSSVFGKLRMLRPSKLPASLTSYTRPNVAPRSAPSTASISSGVHV